MAIRRRIAERIATPLKRAGVETPVLEQIPHRAEELAAFYYEPVHFYAKHNGSETKGTPVDILLQGRTILFQPTASGIFKLVFFIQ